MAVTTRYQTRNRIEEKVNESDTETISFGTNTVEKTVNSVMYTTIWVYMFFLYIFMLCYINYVTR